jgi:hypothetical protein
MEDGALSVYLAKRTCRMFNLSNSMAFMEFPAMSKRTFFLPTMTDTQRTYLKVLDPLGII